MTTYKKILNIALPAMVENFLQMLMGMVDSYLVASLGLVAISGVSVAGNVITIYQAIFIALGAAVSSLISKSLGEGDRDNLAYHTSEAIKLTLILSVFLGLFSLVFGRQILAWLGTEPVVANAGGLYLALIGSTILLLGLMTTLGSLIRATRSAAASSSGFLEVTRPRTTSLPAGTSWSGSKPPERSSSTSR